MLLNHSKAEGRFQQYQINTDICVSAFPISDIILDRDLIYLNWPGQTAIRESHFWKANPASDLGGGV